MSLGFRNFAGALALCVTATAYAAPVNDEITGAVGLSGSGTVLQSSVGATKSRDSQFGGSIENDVWFTFLGDGSAATFNTDSASTTYDTQLFVWVGYDGSSYASLTQIGYDDDSGSGNTSSLSFATTAGTRYWVSVDGFAGAAGNFALNYSVGNVVPSPATWTLALGALAAAATTRRRRNA